MPRPATQTGPVEYMKPLIFRRNLEFPNFSTQNSADVNDCNADVNVLLGICAKFGAVCEEISQPDVRAGPGGCMRLLIVESSAELSLLWSAHLERQGVQVCSAVNEAEAIEVLGTQDIDIIVLDLVLTSGSAFAVADFASYRQPAARVIFVTNTTFFSDGSIFKHIPNACAFLPVATDPEDLAAVIDYYSVAQKRGTLAIGDA